MHGLPSDDVRVCLAPDAVVIVPFVHSVNLTSNQVIIHIICHRPVRTQDRTKMTKIGLFLDYLIYFF